MNDTSKLIDLELGASLVGGSSEMAKELLTMLVGSLSEHKKELEQAFADNDLDELRKAAHKLHGATCYTGTPMLKQASADLENAIKEKQQSKINDLYQILQHAIDDTRSAAADL